MTRFLFVAVALLPLLAACDDRASRVAADRALDDAAEEPLIIQDRFLIRRSAFGHAQTLSRLFEALDRRELAVFAAIDHAAAAASTGAELAPSTVVIFGDPAAGTVLLQEVPLLGAELPLRALVFDRGEDTYLAVTGIANLTRSYPLEEQEAVLDRMEGLLSAITEEVTTP